MAVVLVLLGCSLAMAMAAPQPSVSLYLSERQHVLDLKWDNGPLNLAGQLVAEGFAVAPHPDGQPDLQAAQAYVVPSQNGQVFYSEVEDMAAVAQFVQRGGLVVLLDANSGKGEAVKDFVSKALDLQGDWSVCKQFTTNARSSLGAPVVSKHATSFMPGAWPATLEDAQVTTIMSHCSHSDPSAVSVPLYTVLGDQMKTVAQAFTKSGTPGAIVWLGYSWKDGMQENWGEVLRKVITEFASGRVESAEPLATLGDNDADAVEGLIETVSAAAADATRISRRLNAASYPPSPAPPAPSPPAPSPPSPAPAAPTEVVKVSGNLGVTGPVNLTALGLSLCVSFDTVLGPVEVCIVLDIKIGAHRRNLLQTSIVQYVVQLVPSPGTSAAQLAASINTLVANSGPSALLSPAFLAAFPGTTITAPSVTVVPVSAPPAPLPPSPSPSPSPSPLTPIPVIVSSPSPSPSPATDVVAFTGVTPPCTVGITKPLVCLKDADYGQQRAMWSATNLLNPNRKACFPIGSQECYTCPRTFRNWDFKNSTTIKTLALYFTDAVQISEFNYAFTKNPGLAKVELLAYPVEGLSTGNPKPVPKVTVWEGADSAKCNQLTTIKIADSVSNIGGPVPPVGELPSKAFGGVLLTFKTVSRKNRSAFLVTTTFTGRALYATGTYKSG